MSGYTYSLGLSKVINVWLHIDASGLSVCLFSIHGIPSFFGYGRLDSSGWVVDFVDLTLDFS